MRLVDADYPVVNRMGLVIEHLFLLLAKGADHQHIQVIGLVQRYARTVGIKKSVDMLDIADEETELPARSQADFFFAFVAFLRGAEI